MTILSYSVIPILDHDSLENFLASEWYELDCVGLAVDFNQLFLSLTQEV